MLKDILKNINEVTNYNDQRSISLKKFCELIIEYQKYIDLEFHNILYYEPVIDHYKNLSIKRVEKVNDSISMVLELTKEDDVLKYYIYLKEDDKIEWPKDSIITREDTMLRLFDFCEKNYSYFETYHTFVTEKNKSFNCYYKTNNTDTYKTLVCSFTDQNIVSMSFDYINNEIKYNMYIDGREINISNEKKEKIFDNIYINLHYLPEYINDYIDIREAKLKRKSRWIKR